MFKLFLLSWSILASAIGAHQIAGVIEKPLVQDAALKAAQAADVGSLLGQLPVPQTVLALKTTDKPDIRAYAYLAYDAKTSTVLTEKNGYDKRSEASAAKLMTALLVAEQGKLDDVTTVSHTAAVHPGSTMNLREGEQITVKNNLYGLLLNSGNDAATALAEHASGSVDQFVVAMNNRATALGLTKTHFAEPAGYDEENTVLSPYDLAKLMKVVLTHKELADIMLTKEITVSDTTGKITHALTTSNRLIKNDFLGILGGKTGTGTFDKNKAGHVLVAAAERNGHRIIVVVSNTYVNSPDASANEASKLLEFVFANL